jgi:hypothetical protein
MVRRLVFQLASTGTWAQELKLIKQIKTIKIFMRLLYFHQFKPQNNQSPAQAILA